MFQEIACLQLCQGQGLDKKLLKAPLHKKKFPIITLSESTNFPFKEVTYKLTVSHSFHLCFNLIASPISFLTNEESKCFEWRIMESCLPWVNVWRKVFALSGCLKNVVCFEWIFEESYLFPLMFSACFLSKCWRSCLLWVNTLLHCLLEYLTECLRKAACFEWMFEESCFLDWMNIWRKLFARSSKGYWKAHWKKKINYNVYSRRNYWKALRKNQLLILVFAFLRACPSRSITLISS